MNKKLMILGSMDEFVELVKMANWRGIETVVCDGYPDGPAKKYAHKSFDIDVRNTDAIAELCKEEGVNGIIASFSDLLFECLVKIAAKAGLKTYCTPEKSVFLREKTEMKQMFEELGIPTPKSKRLHRGFAEKELDGFSFPVVIKPVNGYGSRGIFVVNSVCEIYDRFDNTSRYSTFPDDILVEEYNSGYEFNMMNWMVDGEVYTISIADREKSVEVVGDIPHVSRVVYPSRLLDLVYDDARSIIKKVADYTGIKTGPLSMQFFYTPGQGIQVCECAGRLFGYEHELVTYASGFNIEELLLDYVYDEAQMKKRLEEHSARYTLSSAGLYFHGYDGRIADMKEAHEVVERIQPVESLFYYKDGEQIGHDVGAKPYVIRLYLKGETREEVDRMTQSAFERIKVYDDSGRNLLYRNSITDYTK